ncbi:hemerythrin domain-containing protein [Arthrobacter sp. I2-34]|uniref:Hemerythrin domain-containing protein n=1 Tax=Arthrobacter hankyongi TaxID=2904801 RepID=A0ABS9L378_9MICC|nr:hemerythrin domain-containing protein [Arthrobacter hankyongi]MCG2621066.1 hemerythrin domain-containing protein [Arthrobacter hankyongi]
MNAQSGETNNGEAARAAMRHHHEQMRHRLKSLADALAKAVAARDTVAEHDAHAVLVEWCETELLPHALAEEDRLYGPAADLAEGRLLVEGMLAEHRAIVGLLEELRGADGVAGAVAAGVMDRIFALHLDKEDRLLLPLLAAAPGLSLADAVEGLAELVGAAHVHRGRSGER